MRTSITPPITTSSSRTGRDSGAIFVGAGAPPPLGLRPIEARLDFSNYGSRVDVQGWGRKVATLDYGDLQACDDPTRDRHYTGEFAGTSSASPIIAGAAVLLEGIARSRNTIIAPATLRDPPPHRHAPIRRRSPAHRPAPRPRASDPRPVAPPARPARPRGTMAGMFTAHDRYVAALAVRRRASPRPARSRLGPAVPPAPDDRRGRSDRRAPRHASRRSRSPRSPARSSTPPIEDTATSAREIEAHFGAAVAAGVQALTKDAALDKHLRMADSLRRTPPRPALRCPSGS